MFVLSFVIYTFSLQYAVLTMRLVYMLEAILLEKPTRRTASILRGTAIFFLGISLAVFFLREYVQQIFPIEQIEVPTHTKLIPAQEKKGELTLEIFGKRSLKETLFLPEFVNSIHCYQRPPRPDKEERGRYFSFVNDHYTFLPNGAMCHLSLTPKGFILSNQETPLALSLSDDGSQATLSLDIKTTDNVEILHASHSFSSAEFPNVVTRGRSKEFEAFCTSISKLALYPPDAFFNTYGGSRYKEKGRFFRIGSLDAQVYHAELGSIFTLQYGALVPLASPKNAECPLFRVCSVSQARIEVEAWDPTGKEYAVIPLSPQHHQVLDVKPDDLFKNIRVKGEDKVVVKVGKKTKLLRPGDYLLKKEGTWSLVDEKDELEGLLNYLNCGMLFVFEGVVTKGNEMLFSGRLFDETRSSQKRVEIPVKVKKKKRIPTRRSEEIARDGYEEIPPELEELLEDLDDI